MCVVVLEIIFAYIIFFFFNDTATTEIYTLSLHDALPILLLGAADQRGESIFSALFPGRWKAQEAANTERALDLLTRFKLIRSEEHTSELQSRQYLVCRLLLEKKKKTLIILYTNLPCLARN